MKVNVRQNLKPKVLLDSAFPGQGLPMISQEELIDKIGAVVQEVYLSKITIRRKGVQL